MLRNVAVVAVLLVAVAPSARAQSSRPKFEVASVKPNTSATRSTLGGSTRFSATGITLRALVQYAYTNEGLLLSLDQVIGGPIWIATERFDIRAKPGGDPRELSPSQTRAMVQSLLEERFQLKVHREMRQMRVYNLLVAKDGPRLKLSDDQTPPEPGKRDNAPTPQQDAQSGFPKLTRGNTGLLPSVGCLTLVGSAVPIDIANSTTNASLQSLLQVALARIGTDKTDISFSPVLDKTGLRGLYDFRLQFGPDLPAGLTSPADVCGTSLFTALQEQLGLKLESARGPVEVVVIDSVSKPSEN